MNILNILYHNLSKNDLFCLNTEKSKKNRNRAPMYIIFYYKNIYIYTTYIADCGLRTFTPRIIYDQGKNMFIKGRDLLFLVDRAFTSRKPRGDLITAHFPLAAQHFENTCLLQSQVQILTLRSLCGK